MATVGNSDGWMRRQLGDHLPRWSHFMYDVELVELNFTNRLSMVDVKREEVIVRILHVPDTHFSLSSDMSPWSDRMHRAFESPTHWETRQRTKTRNEFLEALHFAETMDVDLVALGGDLVNFPSPQSVDDLYNELMKLHIPFLYTAGNHDWHLEKLNDSETSFDSQRMPNENGALQKLYHASGQGLPGNMSNPSFGYVELRRGVRVVCIDNSNFLIDSEQLEFFRQQMNSEDSFVLMMHIPIYFPGLTWGPTDVMGHPAWGTGSDQNAEVEARKPWPNTAPPLVMDFIDAVKRAAEKKQLLAILTGHTHENRVVPVPCPSSCNDSVAMQFTTRPNFGGGARLLVLRMEMEVSEFNAGLAWNPWILRMELDLRVAGVTLMVLAALLVMFRRKLRDRWPCTDAGRSQREAYILGAAESKWEEEETP